jgi:voltage-gated potassium channel
MVAGNAITFGMAYVFYLFEHKINTAVDSYWDAAWWAICTVSTVGYGDIVPVTWAGKATGAILIIVGVCFFLSYMAVLVSVVSELTHRATLRVDKLSVEELERLQCQINELFDDLKTQ